MIIVIDAYNLLRTIPPYKKTITDQERIKFITLLGRYGRSKGHKIVLVFDGGPYEWPFKEHTALVQVIYSGIHESADDYIKEYIETHRAKELLLVTSDRELNMSAAHVSIPSIDSSAFYQLLQEAMRVVSVKKHGKGKDIVKTTDDSKEDIDSIMMSASEMVLEKVEDLQAEIKSRKSQQKQLVKHERQLLKKLRKL